jgi:glycosyltransferase involved in cell wall biosynthesis
MRICVVGPTYPYRGGIAHYTTLLVKHLRERGHRTRLYSFARQYPRWLFPGSTDKDPSKAQLEVDCEYILDPLNPISWWRLLRGVSQDHPDLLVLQWWVPYWAPCLTVISGWIQRHTTIRIVYICHNVLPHDAGGVLDTWLARMALRRGNAFIVHSEQDYHHLFSLLPEANVIRTPLPTYVELADLSSLARPASSVQRADLGIQEDQPILLFFGFVRPYKGIEFLIQSLPLVLKKRNVHLLVVGESWAPPNFYEKYAHQIGVAHAVTFINQYIPNENLFAYFDLADVVVLPYVSATQSATIQLAFGFGKPVITTRVGGLAEVVQDGINGLVVPPQDAQALARAILRFYDEQLAEPLSKNARQTVQEFSWQQLVSHLEHAGRRKEAR